MPGDLTARDLTAVDRIDTMLPAVLARTDATHMARLRLAPDHPALRADQDSLTQCLAGLIEAITNCAGIHRQDQPGASDAVPSNLSASALREGTHGWLEIHSSIAYDAAGLSRLVVLLHAELSEPGHYLKSRSKRASAELERAQLAMNQSMSDRPLAQSLAHAFVHCAHAHPKAAALRWQQGELNYQKLYQAANAMAAWLRDEAKLPEGGRVALLLERTPEAVVACLGVILAGASYVPVDTRQPAERKSAQIADAHACIVLVAQPADAQHLEVDAGRRICVLPAIDTSGADRQDEIAPQRNQESPACLMFTSGSTGRPKAVVVPDRAILRLAIDGRHLPLSTATRMLHAAPLGFDASSLEIWGPLLNGGCCCVHPEPTPSAHGLAASIRDLEVNSAWLTAALFNIVVDDRIDALAGLQHLITGGEALSVAHVRRAMAALPCTRIYNGYGPTECATFATCFRFDSPPAADDAGVPIGFPIRDTTVWILDHEGWPVADGLIGEIHLGGAGLAVGYFGQPKLSAKAFAQFHHLQPGLCLYRTGDLGWRRADGAICYSGRMDRQIKLRGYRIEPAEIESALLGVAGIQQAAVVLTRDPDRLIAYLLGERTGHAQLLAELASRLPTYMLPAAFVWLDELPLNANGKLDRQALPAPSTARPEIDVAYREPDSAMQALIAACFSTTLGIEPVGADDPFFALGADSLAVSRILGALRAQGVDGLRPGDFYDLATPAQLARRVQSVAATRTAPDAVIERGAAPGAASPGTGIPAPVAVIAMDGRFPGAGDVRELWQMLIEGREGIHFFEDNELDASVSRAQRADPYYVRARGLIKSVDCFDAGFFGMAPLEAMLMDPQHRVFLELAWHCLERAGYVPDAAPGPVGVFAGMYNASYYQHHVLAHPEKLEQRGEFLTMLANEKDYLATRVAHRLNLTGPAVGIYSACSTSLVAIASAFDSLQTGACRMALAGGVSITCPPHTGYRYEDGAMLSPDGHTRSFDARASGTVFSDGAAIVLLKRLDDALADGDQILGVIRSAAINNDGANRASFTAPTVAGQTAVIARALDRAAIDARSISYVEAHGTGTPLGDPIEVQALETAFRRHTQDRAFCALGSVKSQLGHCVIAAGATGLIKTLSALRNECLPGTLHYREPNPALQLESSPFVISAEPTPWPRNTVTPRRAGISAFGVGGTNAHIIVEEAPAPREPTRVEAGRPKILRLTARSDAVLSICHSQLAAELECPRPPVLADVAHTLAHGRKHFEFRSAIVANTPEQALAALRAPDSALRRVGRKASGPLNLVMLFPGQGAQYAQMGRSLYRLHQSFRDAFDAVCAVLQSALGFDLRAKLFETESLPSDTGFIQPATFAIEYALAQYWLALGLRPVAVLGHSIGEFAAAVIAGVLPMRDAALLVAKRAQLMAALPTGSMLSVALAASELRKMLPDGVAVAADNAPTLSVAAGPHRAIEALARRLDADAIACKRLKTSHAFHSAMMDPVVAPLAKQAQQTATAAPVMRYMSALDARWITDPAAFGADYWGRHLRAPVLFGPALAALCADLPNTILLEVGPGASLSALFRRHPAAGATAVVNSLNSDLKTEAQALALARAELWCHGIESDDPADEAQRVELPPYPFERIRHWLDTVPAINSDPCTKAPNWPIHAGSDSAASSANDPQLHKGPDAMPAAERATAPPVGPVRERVLELFEQVSGLDLSQVEHGRSFLNLGMDSLVLTQAALQIKKQFGTSVTFRQLMNDYTSIETLTGHLASFVEQPTPPPALPAPGAQRTDDARGKLIREVIDQQMALMRDQLALLGSAGPSIDVPRPAPVSSLPATSSEHGTNDRPASPGPDLDTVRGKPFGAMARIEARAEGELGARQRVRLDDIIARYTSRTGLSKAYAGRHRPHLADPRVVSGFRPELKELTYPLVVERSHGPRVWDLDGNEYIDALNGFGMNLFGWQPDFVLEAVRTQLDRGYEIGPQHPLAGEVARRICEMTGFDRAALCNTGSEAVMGATRIARTVTGRDRIVLFSGSYHGIFDEAIVRAGRGNQALPAAPGIMSNSVANVSVLDYDDPRLFEHLSGFGDDLAAILVEPIQSRRPDYQPIEILRRLRDFSQRNASLLIFDEIVTGFRAHPGGVRGLYGLEADLATYGKVVGGGYPIGVIAGQRQYMDALDGGHWQFGDDSVPEIGVTYFAGTFVRHPLALAAADAVLRHLEHEGPGLQSRLNACTEALKTRLNAYFERCGAPLRIRSFASVWRIEFTESHPFQELLFPLIRLHGVHMLDGFPCFMTTAHTEADIGQIQQAIERATKEMQLAGFLPERHQTEAFDSNKAPVAGARLGRDEAGLPAWYLPDPKNPGQYVKHQAES